MRKTEYEIMKFIKSNKINAPVFAYMIKKKQKVKLNSIGLNMSTQKTVIYKNYAKKLKRKCFRNKMKKLKCLYVKMED